MDRLRTSVIITALVKRLREGGSWCGETHVQKSTYILQEMLTVPLNYEFILYKHGPFSFDFRDELTVLRADGLLVFEPQNPPYGPRISTTVLSDDLQRRFPKTLKRYGEKIDFVAEALKDKGVAVLERLSTALYVTLEIGRNLSTDERGNALVRLKPHVSLRDAIVAVNIIDDMSQQAEHLTV